mgnify:CR=1 FL=1
MVSVFVHGTPKAQPRPRAAAFNGRARVYDAGTAEGWKAAIQAQLERYAGKCIESPMVVKMTFYFPRPKSHFGTGRNAEKLKPKSPKFHLQKPDADNLAKAVMDALSEKSGMGLWKDDTQVVSLTIFKEWAGSHPSGMMLEIERVVDDV